MNDLNSFLAKNRNKKIVFTNGCFDIIHRGHVHYLTQAKSKGDLLIIGLNSDLSVRGLKGFNRPINNQDDRKYVLENLKPVDFVCVFEEETPLELIKRIKPHVLVKGGDWKIADIVGSKEVIGWGGEVYSLDFVKNYSTTDTIKKINS